jgi:hypothetical protein
MDSNSKDQESFTLQTIIQIVISCTGLIFYVIAYILFAFYFKHPTLIKKEIFTFIFLYSLKILLGLILSPSTTSYLICYFIGIISYYFIITFINKSLTSKKLTENPINFELEHKHYIFLALVLSSFPIIKIYNLSEKFIFVDNLIQLVVLIFIYRYFNIKIKTLLEFLKEKKVTNTTIPDIYLPYMRAYYYYTTYSSVNLIFFDSFIIIICFYSINIIYILTKMKFLCYVALLCDTIGTTCFIFGCLVLFYTLNKKFFGIGKIEEEGNISNFTVIDVDIQQEEKDESSSFTIRKKKNKNNKMKLNKDDDSYVKIESDETKENEKDKDNHLKGMEEAESLNKI